MTYRLEDLTYHLSEIRNGLITLNDHEEVEKILDKINTVFDALYEHYKDKEFPFTRHCHNSHQVKINVDKKQSLLVFSNKLIHSSITHSTNLPYLEAEIQFAGDSYGFIHIFFRCKFGETLFVDKWVFFWEYEKCNIITVVEDIDNFFSQLKALYQLTKNSGNGITSYTQVNKFITNSLSTGIWNFTASKVTEDIIPDEYIPTNFHPQQFYDIIDLKSDADISDFIEKYKQSVLFYREQIPEPQFNFYLERIHVDSILISLTTYLTQIEKLSNHFTNKIFKAKEDNLINIDEYNFLSSFRVRYQYDNSEPYNAHIQLMTVVPSLYLRGEFNHLVCVPTFCIKPQNKVIDYNLYLDKLYRTKLSVLQPYFIRGLSEDSTIEELLEEKDNITIVSSTLKLFLIEPIRCISKYYDSTTPVEEHAQRKEIENNILNYIENILNYSSLEKELYRIGEIINAKESI